MNTQYHPLPTVAECSDGSMLMLLAKNERGVPVQSRTDMFHRVADEIARLNPRHDDAVSPRQTDEVIGFVEISPNSPTLMNAGRPLQQLQPVRVTGRRSAG